MYYVIFFVMLNVMSFLAYLSSRDQGLSDKKQNLLHFFCPVGSLIGMLLFSGEKRKFSGIIYGFIFNVFLIVFLIIMTKG